HHLAAGLRHAGCAITTFVGRAVAVFIETIGVADFLGRFDRALTRAPAAGDAVLRALLAHAHHRATAWLRDHFVDLAIAVVVHAVPRLGGRGLTGWTHRAPCGWNAACTCGGSWESHGGRANSCCGQTAAVDVRGRIRGRTGAGRLRSARHT